MAGRHTRRPAEANEAAEAWRKRPGAVEGAVTTGPDGMIGRTRAVVVLYALVIVGGLALFIVVGLTHG